VERQAEGELQMIRNCTHWYVHTLRARLCLSIAMFVGCAVPTFAQLAQISHFVSPSYPALARQAMISGQAVLQVTVDEAGLVVNMLEKSSAHPLLTQGAKTCVGEWKFHPGANERRVVVVFYYGFSGTTRASNPSTAVKADFAGSTIRVFITTDPFPAAQP
jgi:TonB family protein